MSKDNCLKYFWVIILGNLLCLFKFNFVFAQNDTLLPDNVRKLFRTVVITASAVDVFEFMDDIGNTGMHMTQSNGPMFGSKLNLEWLTEHKTGPGTKYRWTGKVLGMKMDFSVEVTNWIKGKEKIWGTIGEARMIVLLWYKMYLILTPLEDGSTQTELGIYYTRSHNLLGLLLARSYAKWCVKSMLRDTKKHFENVNDSNHPK